MDKHYISFIYRTYTYYKYEYKMSFPHIIHLFFLFYPHWDKFYMHSKTEDKWINSVKVVSYKKK